MEYTISEESNRKVEKDLIIICEEIRKNVPGVLSIILTGSFSRGEGPVKKIGRKFYPYNDYDIQVIIKSPLKKSQIDQISIDISKKLGYKGIGHFYCFKKNEQKMLDNFYLDLKIDTPEDLKKLLPRIRNYELKNDSKILWGKDFRYLIPDYKLEDIPLSEGAKLILDRMSQMVEYYSLEGEHDKEFLNYIIQQAYAACCTSLLQISKKYQIGYKKSMEIFKKNYKKDFPRLYKKLPELDKKIEEFTNWKINPQKLPNENVEEEWFIAKKNLIEVSKYFFSEFFGKEIDNLEQLSDSILRMRDEFYGPYLKAFTKNKLGFNLNQKFLFPFVSLFLKYKYYERLKKFQCKKFSIFFQKQADLFIFGSLIFIIGAINEDGVDDRLLGRGRELLKKVYPVKGKNWEEISIDYANAYIYFFLQKI